MSKILCENCFYRDSEDELPGDDRHVCLYGHMWFMTVRNENQCEDYEDGDDGVHLSS